VQGSPVVVDLQVGRWRCGNGQCARKIFTERIVNLIKENRQAMRSLRCRGTNPEQ